MDKGNELFRSYVSGDEQSFRELVWLYKDSLIFFINRYVRNLSCAEEIAEDSFVELLLHKDRFNFNTTDLICKLNRLNIDMKNLKGKKVYGYLPKELKKSVNDIVEELYKIPSVKSLYDKWIEVNNLKLSAYYDSKDNPFIKMSDNKEFNFVKNMIIKAAIELGQFSDFKHPPKLMSNIIVDKMTGSILSTISDLIFDLDNRIKAKIPQIVESKQMQDIIEKKIARGLKYEAVEEKEEPEEEQGFGLIM